MAYFSLKVLDKDDSSFPALTQIEVYGRVKSIEGGDKV